MVQAKEVAVNHAATTSNYALVYPNINFSSPNSGTTYNPTNSNSLTNGGNNSLSNGSGNSSSSGNQSYTIGNTSNYMHHLSPPPAPNPNLLSPDYRPDMSQQSYSTANARTTSPFSTAIQQTPIRISSADKQPHYLPVPYQM